MYCREITHSRVNFIRCRLTLMMSDHRSAQAHYGRCLNKSNLWLAPRFRTLLPFPNFDFHRKLPSGIRHMQCRLSVNLKSRLLSTTPTPIHLLQHFLLIWLFCPYTTSFPILSSRIFHTINDFKKKNYNVIIKSGFELIKKLIPKTSKSLC